MRIKILFFISLLFIGSITTISSAAVTDHISPYGNLYLFFGGYHGESYTDGEEKITDTDLVYRINNSSNLGFNFEYEKYKGVFELGIDDIENDREVVVRKAFGEYKLSSGMKLMIGQNWTPYVRFSNEAADYYRSKGFGSIYEETNIQIELSAYNFYISIMKPYVAVHDYYVEEAVSNPASTSGVQEYAMKKTQVEQTTGLSLDNIKSVIPKVAVGYELQTNRFRLNGGLAGNMYLIEDTDTVQFNKKYIYSYLVYLNSNVNIGDFIIGISSGFIVNPANFGVYAQSEGNSTYAGGAAVAIENIATGKFEIKDTWNFQGYLEIGYQVTPKVLLHTGFGYSIVEYPTDGTEQDKAFEAYLNCKFNIGGLIALTPSFSYRDFQKDMDGKYEGKEIYGGILATVSYY
ncbi:MAG: hypothetical protein JW864_17180 [Spirochaetes bacterium]|nr:hypothetical protein [Spirochaetota bacterium]